MIRLIVASNLASSSDALSSGTEDSAMDSWVSVFEIDGGVTVFLKYAMMQLSFLPDYLDAYFRGFGMLVGTLAVLCFFIGLFCRVMFGADDRSLIGRSFYLSGDVVVCLISPLLYRWIDVRVKWLQNEHQRLVKLRDKNSRRAIRDIQGRLIELYESKRVLNGIVHGFYDAELQMEKYRRYQSSRMEECSDPEYWQEVNRLNLSSSDDEETSEDEPVDQLRALETARQRALDAARDALHDGEVRSDGRRMKECENTINMLTTL